MEKEIEEAEVESEVAACSCRHLIHEINNSWPSITKCCEEKEKRSECKMRKREWDGEMKLDLICERWTEKRWSGQCNQHLHPLFPASLLLHKLRDSWIFSIYFPFLFVVCVVKDFFSDQVYWFNWILSHDSLSLEKKSSCLSLSLLNSIKKLCVWAC